MSLKSYLEYEMSKNQWTIPTSASRMSKLNAEKNIVCVEVKDQEGNDLGELKAATFSYQQVKRLLNYASTNRMPREGTTKLLATLFGISPEEFERRCKSNVYDNATLENKNSEIKTINIVKYIEHQKKLDREGEDIDYYSKVYEELRRIDEANGVSSDDMGVAQDWVQIMKDFPHSTTLLVDSSLKIVGDVSVVYVKNHSAENDNKLAQSAETFLPMDIGGKFRVHILSLQVEPFITNNLLLVEKLLEIVKIMAESGTFWKSASIKAYPHNVKALNLLGFKKIDNNPVSNGSLYLIDDFLIALREFLTEHEPTGKIKDLLESILHLYH